jgi:hypothetical protein
MDDEQLRDDIAVRVMEIIFTDREKHFLEWYDDAKRRGVTVPDIMAMHAYEMADAMLRARAAQSPSDVMRAHLDEFGGDK